MIYVSDPGINGQRGTGGTGLPSETQPAPPVVGDLVHSLDHCEQAVGTARRIAREFLKRWNLDVADSVVLLVSELVTNAVEHALPPLVLHLHHDETDRRFWVGVSDSGPASHAGPWISSCTEEEHGRGQSIVEALTDTWGVHLGSDGRTTHWVALAAT